MLDIIVALVKFRACRYNVYSGCYKVKVYVLSSLVEHSFNKSSFI